jgi:hypothetical protein
VPGGIRQTEIHAAEPFVPDPSTAEVEVAIRKLKRCKALGSDQIPAGGGMRSEIQVGRWGQMDLREIGLEGVDWIRLTQDRDRWRAVVSAVMNLPVLASRS